MTAGRGPALYDRLAAEPWLLGVVYAVAFLGREERFRRQSIEALSLAPGERVLELGCGTGNSLAALADRVGPTGRVLGVDYSTAMARAAAARAPDGASVVHGDATRAPVADGSFDAVYAAMSLSATADPDAGVRAAHAALRPGGRLVVLDARSFQRPPWTALDAVVEPVARRLTNWQPGRDVVAAVREAFDAVETTTATGGAVVVARAER